MRRVAAWTGSVVVAIGLVALVWPALAQQDDNRERPAAEKEVERERPDAERGEAESSDAVAVIRKLRERLAKLQAQARKLAEAGDVENLEEVRGGIRETRVALERLVAQRPRGEREGGRERGERRERVREEREPNLEEQVAQLRQRLERLKRLAVELAETDREDAKAEVNEAIKRTAGQLEELLAGARRQREARSERRERSERGQQAPRRYAELSGQLRKLEERARELAETDKEDAKEEVAGAIARVKDQLAEIQAFIRRQREERGQRREGSPGQRLERAIGELRVHLERLRARAKELAETENRDVQEQVAGQIAGAEARLGELQAEAREGRDQPRGERRDRRRPEGLGNRVETMRRAAELLAEAGLGEYAREVSRRADELLARGENPPGERREHPLRRDGERPRPPGPEARGPGGGAVEELRQAVRQLREELGQLRQEVSEIRRAGSRLGSRLGGRAGSRAGGRAGGRAGSPRLEPRGKPRGKPREEPGEEPRGEPRG